MREKFGIAAGRKNVGPVISFARELAHNFGLAFGSGAADGVRFYPDYANARLVRRRESFLDGAVGNSNFVPRVTVVR